MKERIANIRAIILVLVSIIETVVVGIFGFYEWYEIVMSELVFILGVGLVRFPYQLAKRRNRMYELFNKENSNEDYEPSKFAVNFIKFTGYFGMFLMSAMFLLAAILY